MKWQQADIFSGGHKKADPDCSVGIFQKRKEQISDRSGLTILQIEKDRGEADSEHTCKDRRDKACCQIGKQRQRAAAERKRGADLV